MRFPDVRRTLLVTIAAAAGLLAATAAPVSAQTGLAAAKAVRCSFQRQAVGSWKKDGVVDTALRPSTIELRFDAIDTDAGTAQLKNGAVGSEVTLRSVEGYLHFMQAFRTGPLYTTTIFGAGASSGKYKAVHSRHEYFSTPVPGATSSPEQYYGECELVGDQR